MALQYILYGSRRKNERDLSNEKDWGNDGGHVCDDAGVDHERECKK